MFLANLSRVKINSDIEELLKSFLEVSEYRDAKGLRYPASLLVLSWGLVLMAERRTQQASQKWLSANWPWIILIWEKLSGQSLAESAKGKGPSRVTLSRCQSNCDSEAFERRLGKLQCRMLAHRLGQRRKNRALKAEDAPMGTDGRKVSRGVRKPLPQLCVDGKTRKGCESPATGRTAMDVRLFCADTNQILGSEQLSDKEGERRGCLELLNRAGDHVPKSLMTMDAGILSPEITAAVREKGHEYLAGLKGNSGHCFEICETGPWDRVTGSHTLRNKANGRVTSRTVKRMAISNTSRPTEFTKYTDAKFLFQVTRTVQNVKSGNTTTEVSYYLGSQITGTMSLAAINATIREHWAIESMHWVRDAVLGEDRCIQKRPGPSRFLSVVRDVLLTGILWAKGSVRNFLDDFCAAPMRMLLQEA